MTTVAFGDVHRIVASEPIGRLVLELGRLIPYLLVCAAFACRLFSNSSFSTFA